MIPVMHINSLDPKLSKNPLGEILAQLYHLINPQMIRGLSLKWRISYEIKGNL